jgi:hypothetical protein
LTEASRDTPDIALHCALSRLLQRFVPTHELDSEAVYGINDSLILGSTAKLIAAFASDSLGTEAFRQHWLKTQQFDVRRITHFVAAENR